MKGNSISTWRVEAVEAMDDDERMRRIKNMALARAVVSDTGTLLDVLPF